MIPPPLQVLSSQELERGSVGLSISILIEKGLLQSERPASTPPDPVILVDEMGHQWRCKLEALEGSLAERNADAAIATTQKEAQSGGLRRGIVHLVGLSSYFEGHRALAGDMLRIGDGRGSRSAGFSTPSLLLPSGSRSYSVRLLKKSDVARMAELLPLG